MFSMEAVALLTILKKKYHKLEMHYTLIIETQFGVLTYKQNYQEARKRIQILMVMS